MGVSKNPTLAGLTLKSAIYSGSAYGKIHDEPEDLIRILAPAVEDIESSAREQLAALRTKIADMEREHEAQRKLWEYERKLLTRLREEAEADCAAQVGEQHPGPLKQPHGFYVYFLWARDDSLLYVGMSTNILLRLGQHLSNPERRYRIARITTTRHRDEAEMRRVETRAIWNLHPPWNVQGVPA